MLRRLSLATILGPLILHTCVLAAPDSSRLADEVSYTNDIRPIVRNFCTTCHAGDDPEGGFVLTSYADVRKHTEKGKLLVRIEDVKKPMPQNGLLPRHMRRLFRSWAAGGYVNVGTAKSEKTEKYANFEPPEVVPVDVSENETGFALLSSMQGHWVGDMTLMGRKLDWMAFDYRAIAPSHVHGIFEGGTIGNLFTSFFVTEFNGKRTIMARNGGMLNGIYRTSYFVLDTVRTTRRGTYYRLVDARGGDEIMWMELTFHRDTILFESSTSRFGLTEPRKHMSFRGRRMHPELAAAAAKAVGFPRNVVDRDFSNGLPKPGWAEKSPWTSASYIWEDGDKGLVELGKLAGDPYRIDHVPHVGRLSVSVKRPESARGKKLFVFLSRRPLTDDRGEFVTRFGYVRADLLNGILSFPELAASQDAFTFTYLHPGEYFLTVVADLNGDELPSPGDVTHSQFPIRVKPESHSRVLVDDLRRTSRRK